MQTLDIQQDTQPIHYAKAVQSEMSDKYTSAELNDKHIFRKMLQDMLIETEVEVEDSPQLLSVDVKHVLLDENKEKNTETLSLHNKMHKKNVLHKHDNRTAAEIQGSGNDEIQAVLCLVESNPAIAADDVRQYGKSRDKTDLPMEINAAGNGDAHEEHTVLFSEPNYLMKKDKKRRDMSSNLLNGDKKTLISDKEKKNLLNSEIEDYQNSVKHKNVKQPKPVFTVVDERSTEHFAALVADTSVHEPGSTVVVENSKTTDMILDLNTLSENTNLKTENGLLSKETSSSSFSAVLAERIQEMSNDFVQAGNIILKDNNAGIIRLHLQPAYLGSVRINLELGSDKKVLGKIIVGSKDTYDAFRESIEALSEAFETGGFSGAHFDVSWSGEADSGMAQGDSEFSGSFAENSRLGVMQEKYYADTQITYEFESNQAINVLA